MHYKSPNGSSDRLEETAGAAGGVGEGETSVAEMEIATPTRPIGQQPDDLGTDPEAQGPAERPPPAPGAAQDLPHLPADGTPARPGPRTPDADPDVTAEANQGRLTNTAFGAPEALQGDQQKNHPEPGGLQQADDADSPVDRSTEDRFDSAPYQPQRQSARLAFMDHPEWPR